MGQELVGTVSCNLGWKYAVVGGGWFRVLSSQRSPVDITKLMLSRAKSRPGFRVLTDRIARTEVEVRRRRQRAMLSLDHLGLSRQ